MLVIMLLVSGVAVAAGAATLNRTSSGAAPATTNTPSTGDVTAHVDFTYRDGVLARDGTQWELGRPDDVVAVGDWDCDGEATPALLRPATGMVYAFAAWAADSDVQADLVGTVRGGVDVQAADTDGDGCQDIVVTDANGAATVLHARRGA